MSLEQSLDRIANALEKIASLIPATTSQAKTTAETDSTKSGATPIGSARTKKSATAAAATTSETAATLTKTHTFEETRAALIGVKAKLGQEVSRSIMQAVGVANVTDIKPEDFSKVIKLCADKMAAA